MQADAQRRDAVLNLHHKGMVKRQMDFTLPSPEHAVSVQAKPFTVHGALAANASTTVSLESDAERLT